MTSTSRARRRRAGALLALTLMVGASGMTWLAGAAGAVGLASPAQGVIDGLSGSSQSTTSTTTSTTSPAPAPQPHRSVRHRVATTTTTSTSTTLLTIAAPRVMPAYAAPISSTYSLPRYPASAVIPPGGVWPAEDPGVRPFAVGLVAVLAAIAGGAAVGAFHRRDLVLAWVTRRRDSDQ